MGTIKPRIRFCCISYNDTILVSGQIEAANYISAVRSVLVELPHEGPQKLTYPLDSFQVHILVEDYVVYSCVTDRTDKHLLPFTFLESVRNRFIEIPSLLSRSPTASEDEFERDFGPVLASIMQDFNSGRGDKVSVLQSQVEDVKQVMLENVEKIIHRGEKLEDLLSKTEDLEAHGSGFRQRAREVHARARCQNLKMWLIISAFLGTVLTLALLIAVGIIPL